MINKKERNREYYEKNKGEIKEYRKKYYEKNKGKGKYKEYRKEYREKNKNKAKENRLINRYNLTFEQFEQMKTGQDNKCAICKKVFVLSKHAHVDHNHTTGKVRQLLCSKCNGLLGFCNEDISILNLAVEYLRKWS